MLAASYSISLSFFLDHRNSMVSTERCKRSTAPGTVGLGTLTVRLRWRASTFRPSTRNKSRAAGVAAAFMRPARSEFPMRKGTSQLFRQWGAMSRLRHLWRKFVGGTAESAVGGIVAQDA